MWPMLLNLTRDECRRTLRRLELEAYSNMISVFRAQGPLEESRKKLLEELRAVLHISSDRHSAEARRVSNDEFLATIAENVFGPNTGIGWICEGRRRIPLLPRGIPQTAYTEIADRLAEDAAEENRQLQEKLEAEKLMVTKTNEEDMMDVEVQTAEAALQTCKTDDILYPLIATEDQAAKLWETEIICRKRKLPEGALPEDTQTPVKNMRNIPVNTNQKHLNLSKIYSKLSHTSSKPLGHSKHSYNQVGKVSSSKTNQSHRSTPNKPRAHRQSSKNAAQTVKSKSQTKKQKKELPPSPSKAYTPNIQLDYTGPPGTFQASYAQSILSSKLKHDYDYDDEIKPKVLSPGMISDSPTMQLLTQPATLPHELGVSDNTQHDDPKSLQAQSTPVAKHTNTGKPCHLIIKKRPDISSDKNIHVTDDKIIQKPVDGMIMKPMSNRQVVVAPSSAQKALNTGKLVPAKVISSVSKQQMINTSVKTDKMVVVSKPSDNKSFNNPKMVITSSTVFTPNKKDISPVTTSSVTHKATDTLTPKGIPAPDLKVSAKTFVLNSKSGQKMVVLPAKGRAKPASEGQMPVLHFKSLATGMKLVPVTCQTMTQGKTAMTVVSRPISSTPKVMGIEPIKTANMADIVPVKGLSPMTTHKITNPIIRTSSAKGNVIVLQKRATLGKTLTFTKNGNDMSKIIMGKNVNQLLKASKTDDVEATKRAGNVIVLELNNDQTGRTTTMSEILDGHSTSARVPDESNTKITQDTPVLFDSQITEDTCNTSSLDSVNDNDSLEDIVPVVECIAEKDVKSVNITKTSENVKDSSSVTDWEIELETVAKKAKNDDDKLNTLHLDLGMSSDSENDFMSESHKTKIKKSLQKSPHRTTPSGESSEIYSSSSGMSVATRTLLSQLQDDGSSSNDSSFTLKSKTAEKVKDIVKMDKSESEELTKAKEKLSEKVAKSQLKRIDVYSTAITTSDINLDSFSYLDEEIMAGDDEFATDDSKSQETQRSIDEQLSRLLGEDSANSNDSQTVSESLTSKK